MLNHYANCHFAECRVLFTVVLNIITLSVVMHSVVMHSVVMLSVVMLSVVAPISYKVCPWERKEAYQKGNYLKVTTISTAALFTNIRLGCLCFPMANALAYFASSSVTKIPIIYSVGPCKPYQPDWWVGPGAYPRGKHLKDAPQG